MNLEELRRIREQERGTDSLQHLRPEFYDEVASYLSELRRERNELAAAAEDPFTDPDVKRVSDELQAAERTVDALYERRVGKIVKLASFAAADMAAEVDGLTTEERDLFDTIVRSIGDFGEQIHHTLHEETSTVAEQQSYRSDGIQSVDKSDTEPTDSSPDIENATTNEELSDNDSIDRITVRITEDIGPIVGVDERDYSLAIDDIVTLPTENAKPLIDGDAAEVIE